MRETVLKNHSDPATKAYYLVCRHEYQIAEKTIVKNQAQFDGDNYPILLEIAKSMEKQCPLAATVLYRALLDSILKRGISKYYSHALRYCKKLFKLDKKKRCLEWSAKPSNLLGNH